MTQSPQPIRSPADPHTGQKPAARYLDPSARLFLGLLAFVTALQAIGTTITLPALPAMAEAFNTSTEVAQLTLSLYLGGVAFGQILFGALSDRFGRRPVLLGAMLLFTLAGVACTLAVNIEMLIAARALQGFGGGAGMILGRAIVRDHFDRDRGLQVMSVVVGVMTMTPMISPFLGSLLLMLGHWRWIFALLTGISALLTLATWRYIAESIRQKDVTATDPRRIVSNCLSIVGRADFVSFPIVAALIFGGFFAYLALIPFIAVDTFGLSHAAAGWLTSLNGLALWSGALTNNRLSGRWPVRRLLRFATGLALAAGLTCLVVTTAISYRVIDVSVHPMLALTLLVIPTIAYTFTFGITQPNTIVMSLQPVPHVAGVASAVGATIQMSCAALLTWFAGAVYTGTPTALGLILAGTAALSMLVFRLLAQRYTPAHIAQGARRV